MAAALMNIVREEMATSVTSVSSAIASAGRAPAAVSHSITGATPASVRVAASHAGKYPIHKRGYSRLHLTGIRIRLRQALS